MSTPEASRVRLSPGALLQGSIVRHDDRPVLQFLGIPFAEPPVGDLRFRNPVPATLWSGIRQATEYGNAPAQDLGRYKDLPVPLDIPSSCSEDCLYLNVWTPTIEKTGKLAVMVWIYGGAFRSGWSSEYNGTVYSASHGVVFVSFNYRVGPWGFLTDGTKEYPGNMGLMDQILALQWVQQNIAQFGGDPENVTVFGESAGGLSVSVLMLSKLAQGLFHRAICQSGVYGTVALRDKSQAAEELKTFLREQANDDTPHFDIVKYLASKSTEEIITMFANKPITPVLDGHVLDDSPEALLSQGNFGRVSEYMLGCNSDEGALYTLGPLSPVGLTNYQSMKEFLKQLLSGTMGPRVNIAGVTTALMQHYVGSDEASPLDDMLKGAARLVGDMLFGIPTSRAALAYAENCPTFVYHFDHRPPFSPYPDWVHADHAMEVPYVMGDVFTTRFADRSVMTDEDKALSQQIMTYWANFAKTGNPNDGHLPSWPQFTKEGGDYLDLGEITQGKKCFNKDNLEFWNALDKL